MTARFAIVQVAARSYFSSLRRSSDGSSGSTPAAHASKVQVSVVRAGLDAGLLQALGPELADRLAEETPAADYFSDQVCGFWP